MDEPTGRQLSRGVVRLALLAIVVGGAILRLAVLASMPEIVADEGLWTNSTKNFLEFGDWFMDGRTHLFLSPAFHVLTLGSFALFGPSLWAARLVSAVAGTVSILLVYALAVRVSRRQDVALIAATLFATNEWLVMTSRYALVEPTQLMFALAGIVLLAGGGPVGAVSAGVLCGLAVLTKINILFLVPVIGIYAVLVHRGDLRAVAIRLAVVSGVALAVAAAGYAWLYAAGPDRFVAAFRYELNGVHFEAISKPLIRVGRFGMDPALAGRTVLALFRESPFLFVLSSLGFVVSVRTRPRGTALFVTWSIVGAAFFLLQMFQPTRYFYLISPGLCFLAAIAIADLAVVSASDRPVQTKLTAGALAVCAAFGIGFVGLNAIANRGTMLRTVVSWAERHTDDRDTIMASGYFCTDLPRRAYAQYSYDSSPDVLLAALERLGVSYVIVDRKEWKPALEDFLQQRFPVVQRWTFGAVYDVREAGRGTPGTDVRTR